MRKSHLSKVSGRRFPSGGTLAQRPTGNDFLPTLGKIARLLQTMPSARRGGTGKPTLEVMVRCRLCFRDEDADNGWLQILIITGLTLDPIEWI
jgi:hypothetical protein